MRGKQKPALPAFLVSFGVLAVFLMSLPGANERADQRKANTPSPSAIRYGELPLAFEPNVGQTDGRVSFLCRGSGYTLFLTEDEAVLSLRAARSKPATQKQAVVRMKLLGGNGATRTRGVDKLPGTANYFMGSDPANWRTGIPTYRKVVCNAVYPGVDLVYYGNQRQLEYDFIVAPGADAGHIKLGFDGANRLEVSANGDLLLHADGGQLLMHKPFVYQLSGDARQEVSCSYALEGSEVGFEVGPYDAKRTLFIDPILAYATYLGGNNGTETGFGIAVDSLGSAYVTGETNSSTFPTTAGAFQQTKELFTDVFVSKLNADGSALVYSTYLGGSSSDSGRGIAVDSAGNAYVAGETQSSNFPTANAMQPVLGGGLDAFVTKLNPMGSALAYSTYLGGVDFDAGRGIAIDSAGNAYVTGETFSMNFPGASLLQRGGGLDAFAAKLNAAGSALVYSRYVGGSADDAGKGVAVDAAGSAYLTGFTSSSNFPTATPRQASLGGGQDAFVSKLDAAGAAFVYSTYHGGSANDVGAGIAVDSAGNAYVTGDTDSVNFPTANALQAASAGGKDAFVSKLNPAGSGFVYSTYLGSAGSDRGSAIAADSAGAAYVTGDTDSNAFPTTTNAFQTASGGLTDAFVAKLNATGSMMVYSSYLGGGAIDFARGIAVDPQGNAYVTGKTESLNFPSTLGSAQKDSAGGGGDAFVAKVHMEAEVTTVEIDIKPGSFPNSINLGSTGTVAVAILSSETFDARDVDPATVTLARAPVRLRGRGTPMASFEHVNGDGLIDMIVHVETEALELTESDTEAVLEGRTHDGRPIRGTDSVRIVQGP